MLFLVMFIFYGALSHDFDNRVQEKNADVLDEMLLKILKIPLILKALPLMRMFCEMI